MSGKPAARLSDPTACPVPGHGVNPIANGSPDVLFDGLNAARQGDSSACGGALVGNVIPNVLINGKPATTLGSIGSHGNVVIGGSGTVLIGTSHSAAAFSAPSALAVGSAAAQALAPDTPNSPARTTDIIARTWQEEPGDPAPLGLEEEDEEEELEEQTQQGITLRVGFFFDGTGDNDANVARGAQCRANQLGYDAADERALLDYCPPHQMDPMSSYARERTNISRLYDLYSDDVTKSLRIASKEQGCVYTLRGSAHKQINQINSSLTWLLVMGILVLSPRSREAQIGSLKR
jgi:uncharacterized Zn-binding protein involved in type VI secretion